MFALVVIEFIILTQEHRDKIANALKGIKWADNIIQKRRINLIKALKNSPNKFELEVQNYLNKNYPGQFKFVGDGTTIINGKNPDFIDEVNKTVVLANGVYWHLWYKGLELNPENKNGVEIKESRIFQEAGYRVLFVWEDEIYSNQRFKYILK